MRRPILPSPSMVVALAALVLAATGGAYALSLGRNSVKSKQIARNAVKSPEVARNAVKSSEIGPNAATGADVNEGTLLGVNADKLDGLDSGALVRSFGGHVDNTGTDAAVFAVPELQVRIIGQTGAASDDSFRIHNQSTTADVQVSDLTHSGDVFLTVDPGVITANQDHPGPLLLTSGVNTELMLLFQCAAGQSRTYCFGHLMRAPERS